MYITIVSNNVFMRKELRKPFFIGMFNGVVFTFAFLIVLVKFDESFHLAKHCEDTNWYPKFE